MIFSLESLEFCNFLSLIFFSSSEFLSLCNKWGSKFLIKYLPDQKGKRQTFGFNGDNLTDEQKTLV